MATKRKPQKKKEAIVVPIPQPKAIEINEVDRITGALTALQASEGWAIILKVLNENIAYLEKAILEKKDPASGEGLDDKEIDDARYKRSLNIDLRDTPQNYIRIVRDSGQEPENYDPYPRTKKEVEEMNDRARD